MKTPYIICLVLAMAMVIPSAGQKIKVHAAGALKNYMINGDISAKANLDTLAHKPNLFALGAVENLKGEILIINSQPYISHAANGTIRIDQSFQYKASLLVYSRIKSWREVKFPVGSISYQHLEKFIGDQIASLKLEQDGVFPFRLSGVATSVDWHVIDWPEGDQVHTHEKHKKEGLNGRLEQQKIEVVGFYSTRHKGVFTHHTTNMHLHMINDDQTIVGHVDDLILNKQMKLFLPVN